MGMFCDSWEDAINRIEDAKEYFIKAALRARTATRQRTPFIQRWSRHGFT